MGKDKKHKKGDTEKITKIPRELFEKELRKLQTELCYLQDYIKKAQGRDAAGKVRHWKLSPMDIESWQRWWDYTAAYERMLEATDTSHAPWYRVQADDKRRARLNCISHLLSQFSYAHVDWEPPELGKRQKKKPGTPDKLTFRHEVPLIY